MSWSSRVRTLNYSTSPNSRVCVCLHGGGIISQLLFFCFLELQISPASELAITELPQPVNICSLALLHLCEANGYIRLLPPASPRHTPPPALMLLSSASQSHSVTLPPPGGKGFPDSGLFAHNITVTQARLWPSDLDSMLELIFN